MGNIVFIDLETSGLIEKSDDSNTTRYPEIVEISLIDDKGRPLFGCLLRPKVLLSKKMEYFHGISNEDLQGYPYWEDVQDAIKLLLRGKHLISYNLAFDEPILLHWLKEKVWESSSCLMLQYAEFKGERNPRYPDQYKWHKLPKLTEDIDSHIALGDCLSAYRLYKQMLPQSDSEEEIGLDF